MAAASLKFPLPLLMARLPRGLSNCPILPFHQRKNVWAQWKQVLSQCCILTSEVVPTERSCTVPKSLVSARRPPA